MLGANHVLRTNCRIAASFTKNKAAIKQRLSAQAYLELLASSDDAEEDSGENNRGDNAPAHGQQSTQERAAREESQRLHDACEQMKELQ